MSDNQKIEEPEEVVLTAKDPKKVAQGKWLGSISRKAKKDKLRKEIMEEEFSYLPYILYPLAGISTFTLVLMMFMKRSTNEQAQTHTQVQTQVPKKSPPKQSKKYETLG